MLIKRLLILIYYVLFILNQAAEAREIYVPQDYSTITEAIANASKGDVINLQKGSYGESVIVDKSLTIRGPSPLVPWDDGEFTFGSRGYDLEFDKNLTNKGLFLYKKNKSESYSDYQNRLELAVQNYAVLDGDAMPRPNGVLENKPLMQIIALAGDVFIENIIFRNGKGLVLDNPLNLVTESENIQKNTIGGAVVVRKAKVHFKNCGFINNKSSFQGGAIFLVSGSEIIVNGGLFYNNESFNGGAIYSRESKVSLSLGVSQAPVIFSSNRSKSFGGGLFLLKNKELQINGVVFENNESGVGGGALYSQGCEKGNIINASLRGNLAFEGGAFYFAPSDMTLLSTDLSLPTRADPDMPMVTSSGNLVSTRSDSIYGGRYEKPIKASCILVAETMNGETIRACLMLEKDLCDDFGGFFNVEVACGESESLQMITKIKSLAKADVDQDGDIDVRDLIEVWVAFGNRLESEYALINELITKIFKFKNLSESLAEFISDKGRNKEVLIKLKKAVLPFISIDKTRLEKVRMISNQIGNQLIDLKERQALEDAIRNIFLNKTGLGSNVEDKIRIDPWTSLDIKDSSVLNKFLLSKISKMENRIKEIYSEMSNLRKDFEIRNFQPGQGVYEGIFKKFEDAYKQISIQN